MNTFQLRSPHLELTLATNNGLQAVSLTNRLTGKTLSLGSGPELVVDRDAAHRRLWIEGWRFTTTKSVAYQGFHEYNFDDRKWGCQPAPNQVGWRTAPGTWFWMRTHLFVPEDCAGQPLTLLLGTFGVTDYRFMRVFVNGKLVGTRKTKDRWSELGEFDIRRFLRIGQDNIIALQLAEPFWRTKRLDELDPEAAHCLPLHRMYTVPYMQCLVAGTSTVRQELRVEAVEQDSETSALVRLNGAEIRYELIDDGRLVRKTTRLINNGTAPVRVVRVGLGDYQTEAEVSDGDMGFPVYANDEAFFTIEHPAGWATGERGAIHLTQHPGKLLQPGEKFDCMNVLIGVAEQGQSRPAFRRHLYGRMRRVVRQHDKPYTSFEFFGGWDLKPTDTFGDGFLSEQPQEPFVRHMLKQMVDFRKQTGEQFDLFSFEFCIDSRGDMTRFKHPNFPKGFAPLKPLLKRANMVPAMWLDVAGGGWSIGDNPVIRQSSAQNAAYGGGALGCCDATDPFRTILKNACLYHMRETGVRMFKFDTYLSVCYNLHHAHWPGIYSVEPIMNATIKHCRALDEACPEVFLMAYWAFSSPWWLLHLDTVFECGLFMEGASPAPKPTLYVRDGVNVGLDQGTRWGDDLPPLGKDSLGVWLSGWPWNSQIGSERWQEGFVLDLCRGSLLLQLWSDKNFITKPEREEMATFLALLKAQPECFANPQPIGDPWDGKPYGYSCSSGKRTFLALNNCTWEDQVLPLATGGGDVYRWYPRPAQLVGDTTRIALRPFEVVLLEIVPAGEAPSLPRSFPAEPMSAGFREPSRTLAVTVASQRAAKLARVFELRAIMPAAAKGGTLVIAVERQKNGVAYFPHQLGQKPVKDLAITTQINGRRVVGQPVLGEWTYPCAWQAWRVPIKPGKAGQFTARLEAKTPTGVKLCYSAYFIPA